MNWRTAFILRTYVTHPIYHFDGQSRKLEDGTTEWLTACGKVWGSLKPDGGAYWQATFLPVTHAEKFARPCKVCSAARPN